MYRIRLLLFFVVFLNVIKHVTKPILSVVGLSTYTLTTFYVFIFFFLILLLGKGKCNLLY